jgi:sigma-E factor negative regulatory protein RseB
MMPAAVPPWLRLAVLVACVLPWLAWADADPRARLARMHVAANATNYQGVMVVSTAGVVSSSRVAHFSVADQTFERIESLDGKMQKILRHNDMVHTIWPQANVAVIERRGSLGAQTSLLQTVEAWALEHYELRPEGRERVAGREADVFLLHPRDDLRYAQRLWADVASGLMLRADVISPARVVLESAAFSEVEIGVKPQPETVLKPLKQLGGYRILRAVSERAQIDGEGWTLLRSLPGFRVASCVKRPLEAQAAGDGQAPEQALQAVFSDGLTSVSLFIERFDNARHRRDVQVQVGATSTLMQRRGDHWLTVTGDVPPATLRLLLEALERKR